MKTTEIKAIFWDFGGVFTTSPFVAFNEYEATRGIPKNFIRALNSTNSDTNAWAQLERSEVTIDEFCSLFEQEALAQGILLDGQEILSCLQGEPRPDMVRALQVLTKQYKTACLTNNFGAPSDNKSDDTDNDIRSAILDLFDIVIESRTLGIRKPEAQFYTAACDALDVKPQQVIFLDDLGINLKPARQIGMQTIKVTSSNQALEELETLLGHKIE
ncbi:MAG: HAD-IA family hydrolase [Pseudomonadota bacterium]|nr:HAD-IA family hydrolase [Pseudomonadota bacterium]